MGDKKFANPLAVDILQRLLAFHHDIARRDMKGAWNGAAFERDRADFLAGVGVPDVNAKFAAQVPRFRRDVLSF